MSNNSEKNFVPLPYRKVSYQRLDLNNLCWNNIRDFFVGKDAYYKTEYIVVNKGKEFAIVKIDLDDGDGMFYAISKVRPLAGPSECRYVEDSEVDVGNPSSMASKALEMNVSPSETLIISGKYSHLNFIRCPNPVTINVFDVVPPSPSKLFSMAEKVLSYRDLPPIHLKKILFDIRDHLVPDSRQTYLLPCRASGVSDLECEICFVDDNPEKRDWTVVGCERTRTIYEHFYGTPEAILEICPRKLLPETEPLLIRCCDLQRGINVDGLTAEVPWGAELSEIEEALIKLYEKITEDHRSTPIASSNE